MRTLLKNGAIYDGSGVEPFMGDVLVENEQIIAIGADISQKTDKIIDCTGLCIAPGFIDAHSHNDFFIEGENSGKYFAPFVKQGITTQITGNCGLSPFGVAEDSLHKELVGGSIFNAKNPGSFAKFLDAAQGSLHVNIAPLVGHGAVRAGISGKSSTPLTDDQMSEMLSRISETMKLGAIGGSFGLMYEPGIYANQSELCAFAAEVAKYDGILTVHPRSCSKIAVGYRPIFTKPHIMIAFDEVAQIAEKANVKLHYSHFLCVGKASWACADLLREKMRSLNVTYDFYSFCHGASVITVVLPPWYMSLPPEKRKSKIARIKIKTMINLARKLLGLDFDDFTIADIDDKHKAYLGKNIAEIAKSEGLSKIDMYLKLVELSNGKARIYIGKYNNEEILQKLMQDDLSMFMTDAWIEDSGIQSQTAFQGLPYFLVRAREMGMPLEKAIHKMTGKTAERFCLPSRGLLKVGNFADITVFDYEGVSVNLEDPTSTPSGIKYVLINGNIVVDDEAYKPQTCGQMILKTPAQTS